MTGRSSWRQQEDTSDDETSTAQVCAVHGTPQAALYRGRDSLQHDVDVSCGANAAVRGYPKGLPQPFPPEQEVSSLQKRANELAEKIDQLLQSSKGAKNKKGSRCWTCGSRRHFARDCPTKKKGK